ncbi:MAG: hypothetical protein WCV58_04605 [Patescibacteria group bacterium]
MGWLTILAITTYCLLFLAVDIVLFGFLGQWAKIHVYNFERGQLDGKGLLTTEVKCKRECQIRLIIAWLLWPIGGIWYILGWYLAKDKGYRHGWNVGEGDLRYMDIVVKNLFENSYHKLD